MEILELQLEVLRILMMFLQLKNSLFRNCRVKIQIDFLGLSERSEKPL
jgi:hypothetical protein